MGENPILHRTASFSQVPPNSNDSLAFIIHFDRLLKVDGRQNAVAVSIRDKIVVLGDVEWNTRGESCVYIDIHKDHAPT